MTELYVDADGCPVKDEVYRVARRYDLTVAVVANAAMRVPAIDRVRLVRVEGGLDAADDWIAEHAGAGDIVVTADIPLAARCLKQGARVIDHRGGEFTDESIGDALAGRALMSTLRDLGAVTGGPAPFDRRDRSRFLQRLDRTIQMLRREAR